MKNFLKMLALMCCLSLVVACGDDPENGDNGDNGDTVEGSFCMDTCEEDSECVPEGGDEDDYACVDDVCEFTGEMDEADDCESDEECQAIGSGWADLETGELDTCDAQDECDDMMGESCVEYEGQGYCAMEAADCEALNREELDLELVDEEGELAVCVATDVECGENGLCYAPCESDDDCDADGAGTCLDDGTCGCGSDAECEEDVDNADTCFDGICGCSEDDVCEEDQVCGDISI